MNERLTQRTSSRDMGQDRVVRYNVSEVSLLHDRRKRRSLQCLYVITDSMYYINLYSFREIAKLIIFCTRALTVIRPGD